MTFRFYTSTSKLFVAVTALVLLGAGFFPEARAENFVGAPVGAIRWDAWVGTTNTDALGFSYGGLQVETALGPNQFHDRLPFYGVEVATSSVQVRELTQAQMDADIAYANHAGINYWAIDFYPDGSGFDVARQLYVSSTQRNGLNYAYIVGGVTSAQEAQIVSEFNRSYYQKVLNGRPLIYLFGYSPNAAGTAFVADLRNKTLASGLPTPYVVVLDSVSAADAANLATTLGADAVSTYADAGPMGSTANGAAYSNVASENQTSWAAYAATGRKVIPWVTSGWDNRPRNLNPETFLSSVPPATAWFAEAAPTEISANLQAALTWTNNNQAAAEANTVLMYAWNEFDEGGWLTPTLYHGSDRLDAISEVTKYLSSSSWDSTMTASKAFDGNPSTAWQGAPGPFAGAWLEEAFIQDQTFSQVKLSEYGYRTSGFQIQYLNGSTWKVAYTGGTIGATGVPATFTFPAVTGRAVRVYFTSGTATPIIYEMSVNNVPANISDLALNKSYTSSSNYSAGETPDKAFDGNLNTDWQGQGGFANQWLQVVFGPRTSFNTVTLSEYGNRTSGFVIQYWNGTAWAIAYAGTKIGSNFTATFPTVTASQARIYFTSGTATPIIYEMGVYLR